MIRNINLNEQIMPGELKQISLRMVAAYQALSTNKSLATELAQKKEAAYVPAGNQLKRAAGKLRTIAICLTWIFRLILGALVFLILSAVYPTLASALSENGKKAVFIIFLFISIIIPMLWVSQRWLISKVKESRKGQKLLKQAREEDASAVQMAKDNLASIKKQSEQNEQERLKLVEAAREYERIYEFWLEWTEMSRKEEINGGTETDDLILMKQIIDLIPTKDNSPSTATIIAMSAFDSYKQQKQK